MFCHKTSQTVITYTPFRVGYPAPKHLVEPPHIDILYHDNTTHRFTTKLQNTFFHNDQIIAIWEIDIYIGIVDVKETPRLGDKL